MAETHRRPGRTSCLGSLAPASIIRRHEISLLLPGGSLLATPGPETLAEFMAETTSQPLNTDSIVFFDGVCGLCSHTVDLLLRIDSRSKLKFAPLQGTTAEQLVPANVREDLNTFVFASNGKLHYRSGAMARILMTVGGLWSVLGGLLWIIPFPLRNLGYRIVSRLRYRLFGKHESCRLPTVEERKRFLD